VRLDHDENRPEDQQNDAQRGHDTDGTPPERAFRPSARSEAIIARLRHDREEAAESFPARPGTQTAR